MGTEPIRLRHCGTTHNVSGGVERAIFIAKSVLLGCKIGYPVPNASFACHAATPSAPNFI
jgi:hypothetical protein